MVVNAWSKFLWKTPMTAAIAVGYLTTGWISCAFGQAIPGWQQKWQETLAAARQEGTVVVSGPPGNNARAALTEGFQKSFPGISVVYTGARSSQSSAKLLRERRAMRFAVDIQVGGTTTMLTTLRPSGALAPLKPILILPEAIDTSKWLNGRLDFSDNARKYNLVFTGAVKIPIAINPKLVKADEIHSYKDLLDPKWTGKLAMSDPTGAGSGLATATFWYTHPALGKPFMRELFTKQKIIFSRDNRQLLEWITRGRYAIAISPSELAAQTLEEKGVHVDLVGSQQFKEGSYLSSATGTVGLISRAPHPNAAAVYVNWLLSRDAQIAWSLASGYPSRRLDVPNENFNSISVPKQGADYQENYREEFVMMRDEIRAFLRQVIKK